MGFTLILQVLLVWIITVLLQGRADLMTQDKQALLDFIRPIPHSRRLNWNESTSVCDNWMGVTCNHNKSAVLAVHLPGVGLTGTIPSNTLSRLSSLQILSLRSNHLDGPFPSDLLRLGNLTGVYLQGNKFQGPLPTEFPNWVNLSALNLSGNHFNGSIPSAISGLRHLAMLDIANNALSGAIPDINIQNLQFLNLSNNDLTGVVPKSLLRFPATSFSGNNVSFDTALPPSPLPTPTTAKHFKFSVAAILGIAIGGSVVAFVLIALLVITVANQKKGEKKRMISDRKEGKGKLTFLEGEAANSPAFDLEDLLRASAQVLGKGSFGVAYKATLEDGITVAVKRLTDVNVSKKDFEQHMEVVGKIKHENVTPIRAFYYSRDEKVIVYDYYVQGSVSALLHGKQAALDWETRLKIAIGATRGIAHIHSQSGGKLVHGNIKATNIFLNTQRYGCVSDLGLATLTTSTAPRIVRISGYRAPELTDNKFTQASDVYSFGVFLLELLTGKSPVHTHGVEEITNLVRWVQSVVHEEWTGEVFDVELLKYPNIEEDMVATLQIGLSCVARVPNQRPRISQVLKMLEELQSFERSASSRTRTPSLTPTPTRNVGDGAAGPSGHHHDIGDDDNNASTGA